MGYRIELGKRAALGLLAALALLALAPASAGAVASHPFLPFSPITGAKTGVTFTAVSGVGVDEASHYVFLNNGEAKKSEVDVFGFDGGIPASLTAPYKVVPPKNEKEESLLVFGPSNGAAVDNSPASPRRGSLYVADSHAEVNELPHGKVERFTLNPGTGRYEFADELKAPEPYWEPRDVAVDAQGDVFVVESGFEQFEPHLLYEFSPAGVLLATVDIGPLVGTPGHPGIANGIAVDAAGDVFVSSISTGAVYKLPAGQLDPAKAIEIVPPRLEPKFGSDVGVDTARNILYVATAKPEGLIEQFDAGASEPDPQPQLVFSAGTGVGQQSRIAVDSAAGRIYITRRGTKDVAVLGYGAKLPGLTIGAANGITGTRATLGGAVSPDGVAVSECDFEYLPTAEFANETQKVTLAGATGGTFKLSFKGAQTGAKGEGKLAKESTTVTEVSTTSGAFVAGEAISGSGIKANTTIASFDPAAHKIVLSQKTEAVVPATKTPLAADLPFASAKGEGKLSEESTTVTEVSVESGAFVAGEAISGSGIKANTTIVSFDSVAHKIVLSQKTEAVVPATKTPLAANLPFAGTVQSALGALSSIGTESIAVSGSAGGPYTIEFKGALAETNVEALSADASALTPAGASASVATLKDGRGFADAATEECQPKAGSIPADESAHAVKAMIEGLAPETAYRYRLRAANANGENHSVEGALTTLGLARTDPAEEIGSTEATLNGTVLPEGKALSECFFEYDTSEYKAGEGAHGSKAECQPEAGEIPADSNEHKVSAALVGLAPETAYHFRLAINGGYGAAKGADEHFKTKPGKAEAITGAAEPITGTKATLNGTVNPEGEALTECFFEYGATTAYGQSADCAESTAEIGNGNAFVAVHADVSGLVPNGTEYHFRLVVATASATSEGADEHFKTADTVLTGSASEVGPHEMTLNGAINPEEVPLTQCFFEYGTTTAYGQSADCEAPTAAEVTGNVPVPVHAKVKSLVAGVIYHYRLIAASADGTAKGADKEQKTLSPPTIEREWVASAGSDEATLKAVVNPEGLPTSARVQYGPTTAYGQLAPTRAVGADKQPHTLTFQLEGLAPGSVYHWRVLAKNEIGEAEGADRDFSTARAATPEPGCPNQALRPGPAARLPDCRAYEMVSPVDKNGGDVRELGSESTPTPGALDQSAIDGDGLAYGTYKAFGDAEAAPWNSEYVAARGPAGWASHSVSPPRTTSLVEFLPRTLPEFFLFSPDLCQSWVRTFYEPPLAPGALSESLNLYRRSDAGCGGPGYEALTVPDPGIEVRFASEESLEVQGVAAGGEAAFFAARGRLTADAPDLEAGFSEKPLSFPQGAQLYEQRGGQLHFVCYLPDATPSPTGCRAGGFPFAIPGQGYLAVLHNAVSGDGERVFWTAYEDRPSPSNTLGTLYLRVHPSREQSTLEGGSGPCTNAQLACTIAISPPVEEETHTRGARFWTAAADGSRVIFTVGTNLYEAEIEEEGGHLVSHAHLIAEGVPKNGQLGASEDARRVYFASEETLTSEPNPQGKSPSAGKDNLYLYDANKSGAARFSFIATLAAADTLNVTSDETEPSPLSVEPQGHSARVRADGLRAAFTSRAPLTGYDNTDQVSGEANTEVYLYDATADGGEGRLLCVSCNPSGAPPLGANYPLETGRVPPDSTARFWVAATIPGARNQLYASRPLSADGRRLFFQSFDPLVPADSNGSEDVYEWEAPGKGGCQENSSAYSPRNEGCISLISSGTSVANSEFLDADPEGENVFFTTLSSLLPQDPGLLDIYDARVEGGIPQPPAAPACEGEACQSPPGPPNDPTPASESFQGAGNVREEATAQPRPCAKGKVRRRGKCVARHNRHTKRHRRAGAKRRAGL